MVPQRIPSSELVSMTTSWGPLPDDAREEIYRFFLEEIRRRSPETPVSLCQEPPSMWERLADALVLTPSDFVCCCAKDSVPGHPRLTPCDAATRRYDD